MSKGIKPIVQTYYEFSEVKHREVKSQLSYKDEVFMYLLNRGTYKGMQKISLESFEQLINKYKNAKGGKEKDRCLMKGLYKGGFRGEHCFKNVPYLFFDIDVKNTEDKKENVHLLDPEANQKIFDELKKVSVICWRSKSKNGIAGVLYVPQLAKYLEQESKLHLQAGKQITTYLSEYLYKATGVEHVKFDSKQSVFRQLRDFAEQTTERKLSYKPSELTCQSEVK